MDFATRLTTVTGKASKYSETPVKKGICFLSDSELGPEAYTIDVSKKLVVVKASTAAGVRFATQTIGQMLPPAYFGKDRDPKAAWVLPCVSINDAPRFGYRGLMLDVCRHFFDVEEVKRYLDLMAIYKMNTFHWHLSEDQGWRIEIKKYPLLTEIGSVRKGTIVGGLNANLEFEKEHGYMETDGIPYGGYYTQAELREVVAYAAARHITIVPEIDMPGHMLAALAAYPELGCTGGPYQVGHYWGVYKDVLCVGNPRVYEFVQDVLTEVMDIFPSKVIHIGGDETPSEKWQHCKKCDEIYIKKTLEGRVAGQVEGDSDGPRTMPEYPYEEMVRSVLQPYFTNKVFNILASKGRRALGWDEILDGAPHDAMIMSWRGSAPGAKAAEAGHDVVMAPTTHCYFDYQQVEDTQFEPSRCGGFIPIERVYSLDPAPDSLSVEARSHILGTQANLWSEYMINEQMVEYQALPRMSALAEVQWTQPEHKDYKAFLLHLTRFTSLFERYHYTYAKHLWPDRQIPNRWQF
jgi:hexosaminidase